MPKDDADQDQIELIGNGQELLNQYRHEIQFESQNLSSRLGEYLSCQSFLIIAYASSVSGAWANPGVLMILVPMPLAILGIVLSADAWFSLQASIGTINAWHGQQQELLKNRPELWNLWPIVEKQAAQDPTLDTRFRQGSRFAIHAPWIFGCAWLYLGGVAIALYIHQ